MNSTPTVCSTRVARLASVPKWRIGFILDKIGKANVVDTQPQQEERKSAKVLMFLYTHVHAEILSPVVWPLSRPPLEHDALGSNVDLMSVSWGYRMSTEFGTQRCMWV